MPDPESEKKLLRLHYLKSPGFRSVHVDGAVAGVHPSGRGLHIAMFVERLPIPQQVDHELQEDGGLGPEITETRVAREGVVREVQVDAYMDIETAIAIHNMIGNLLKRLSDLQQQGAHT